MRPMTLWDYLRPWPWKRLAELWHAVQRAELEAREAKRDLTRLRGELDRFLGEAAAVVRRGGKT